jgi:hypothetical protein
MDALVAAAAVMIAINDGNLPAAGDKARAAYDAAAKSKDMPLLAMASGCAVELALALGQHERAAEMLAATSVVRGGEDLTDPMTARLAARLTEALGPDRYAAAYARGRNLDRAEAIGLLDPATLLPDSPCGRLVMEALPEGWVAVAVPFAFVARLAIRRTRRTGRNADERFRYPRTQDFPANQARGAQGRARGGGGRRDGRVVEEPRRPATAPAGIAPVP